MTPKCPLLCFFVLFSRLTHIDDLQIRAFFSEFSISEFKFITPQNNMWLFVYIAYPDVPRINRCHSLIKKKHGVWLKQLIGKVKKTLLVFIKDSDCLFNSSIPLFKPVWNTSEKQGRIVIIVLTLWYVLKKIFKIIQYPHVIYFSNHQMYNFRRRVWQ